MQLLEFAFGSLIQLIKRAVLPEVDYQRGLDMSDLTGNLFCHILCIFAQVGNSDLEALFLSVRRENKKFNLSVKVGPSVKSPSVWSHYRHLYRLEANPGQDIKRVHTGWHKRYRIRMLKPQRKTLQIAMRSADVKETVEIFPRLTSTISRPGSRDMSARMR